MSTTVRFKQMRAYMTMSVQNSHGGVDKEEILFQNGVEVQSSGEVDFQKTHFQNCVAVWDSIGVNGINICFQDGVDKMVTRFWKRFDLLEVMGIIVGIPVA